MRRITVFILISCILLYGCSNYEETVSMSEISSDISIAESNTSSTEQLSEESATTSEAVQPIEYTNNVPIIDIQTIETGNNFFMENTIHVEGTGFEELRDAVRIIQEQNRAAYDDIRDGLVEAVDRYYLQRSDSYILSFCYDSLMEYGETYQIQKELRGYTFRTDGTRVTLSNLILPDKEEEFYEIAESYTSMEYSDAFEDAIYPIEIEDVFFQFEHMNEYQWALDVSGLVFFYQYHRDNFAYDKYCVISIPYSYIEAYINPQYLPSNCVMIGMYNDNDFNYSANHFLCSSLDSERLRTYGIGRDFCNLFIDSSKYSYDNSELSDNGFCVYLRDEEGNSYLAILQHTQTGFDGAADNVKVFDITHGDWSLIYSSSLEQDDNDYMDALNALCNIDCLLGIVSSE